MCIKTLKYQTLQRSRALQMSLLEMLENEMLAKFMFLDLHKKDGPFIIIFWAFSLKADLKNQY